MERALKLLLDTNEGNRLYRKYNSRGKCEKQYDIFQKNVYRIFLMMSAFLISPLQSHLPSLIIKVLMSDFQEFDS